MKHIKPEDALQRAIVRYFTLQGRRDLVLFAIANGDHRHMNVALRLQAQGVRKGVADLCLPIDDGCGWMEVKAPKGGAMSDYQIGFKVCMERLRGHHFVVVRSVDEAARAFAAWGALRPGAQP